VLVRLHKRVYRQGNVKEEFMEQVNFAVFERELARERGFIADISQMMPR
jgi:hypothetical protein